MASVRRWRTLFLVVAVWLVGMWYFFDERDAQPFKDETPISSATVHWSKHPDRYPVTSPISLPTNKPKAKIPNIQLSPAPKEDASARKVRETRLAAVKDSFRHSWNGYKQNAWLHDEVSPLTGKSNNPFGGWAATLVDALDTLWIMDLKDEFKQAVLACERIDFTTTETTNINVFETTIRYLGGFLAAYELSDKQYPTLLKKATEVGELLMCAFDTPNRMPIARWSWKDYAAGVAQTAPQQVLVSEIGSLSLEFTKLSQLTGDMKYYDAVQRISDAFEKAQDTTRLPGMWPVVVDASKPAFDSDTFFTLGGMSDSLYEYFPKQYLLLGGALEQPRLLYEGFVDVAKRHLFQRALNPQNMPLLVSGDVRVSGKGDDTEIVFHPRGQHLTCFTGGMLGIAGRIFSRPSDLVVAEQLTNACVWSYNSTASGIGAEIYQFVPCGGVDDSQTGEKCAYSDTKWREAVRQSWKPRSEDDAPETEAETKGIAQEVDLIIKQRRVPPGFVDVPDRRYILRPEAIESVFIMYRITGDPTWMEKAWQMFSVIEKASRTNIAAAALEDVTKAQPVQVDSMESFWLAETLKYFYLVFASWDTIDLDKWVLNTEAHPLRRPDT
ncbi:seven-hairpin glycosidase [Coniochaeta ligniaria NRRL 30616]|uniref:alpha-1,2-Mannosidase n=1 Tax=Coniochaeta ligniaria NRRL 30616 TaxID=1408157 RepID=A0A1J7IRM7_9PEZI|nr:seven-hairpin glycosidase [Coniochaeta ligniaria NRRL 30616]